MVFGELVPQSALEQVPAPLGLLDEESVAGTRAQLLGYHDEVGVLNRLADCQILEYLVQEQQNHAFLPRVL